MSERFDENKALGFDDERMLQESVELLGTDRLDSLGAFSTEDYLQSILETFMANPASIPVSGHSNIAGGDGLLRSHQLILKLQASRQTAPDRVPRASALQSFFQMGFGIVEHTVVGHPVDQADPSTVTFEAYLTWVGQPLEERREEMKAYLGSQEADLLALNLLEGDKEGTIMQFALGLGVAIPRVTGDAPYTAIPRYDSAGSNQLTEGVLAAMYLLREHQIGQDMRDGGIFPRQPTEPPTTSPDATV